MSFDVSKFLRGLEGPAQQRVRKAGLRAVDMFGEHVIGKAQQVTPVKTGALQNSGTTLPAVASGSGISKTIGFNTNYAAAVHERLDQFHSQGEAKFLETPMRTEAAKLRPFVEAEMRKAL